MMYVNGVLCRVVGPDELVEVGDILWRLVSEDVGLMVAEGSAVIGRPRRSWVIPANTYYEVLRAVTENVEPPTEAAKPLAGPAFTFCGLCGKHETEYGKDKYEAHREFEAQLFNGQRMVKEEDDNQ